MSVLDEICGKKREHVAAQKVKTPLEAVIEKARTMPRPRSFINAIIKSPHTAVIAEVKKASPSVGVIRANFNPVEIAESYVNAGAACLSVLTDEPYFQGSDSYFSAIREAVSIPMLRKDFMIDEYQIYESRALGADCVLLIMAALSDEQAKSFYAIAQDLGMDVLVEIHDEDELARALKLQPAMIGINNRNLKTLKVDVQTSHTLVKEIPKTVIRIAESGISDAGTIRTLRRDGFDGFLIGESLMKEPDIGMALKKLISQG